MQTLSDNATVIEIKGASYAVEAIDAGECGQSAVRLTKLVSGESYDVIRTHCGTIECDCPDYETRRRGTDMNCKHGAACLIHGLLPVVEAPKVAAPAPAPVVAPVVAPITRLDLVRARTWGLRLPDAPMVEAVKTGPTPAQARQLETLRQRCEERKAASALRGPVDPDEGFELDPATAIDRFTAGVTSFEELCQECLESEREEEREFVAEPMPAGSNPVEFADEEDEEPARVPDGPVDLDSPWVNHFAWLYAPVVLECVGRARDKARRDSPLYPWRALLEGERRSFVRWFDRVGFEVDQDCDWTRFDHFLSLCLVGSPVSFPEPGPAPSWDAERFEPTLDEEAEWGEDDPAYHAWLDERYAERMAEIMAEPGDGWHESERVAAVGCLQARLA